MRFVANEIIQTISRISSNIEREVSVAIDRRGKSCINYNRRLNICRNRNENNIRERRLSGVRVIHTHPNGYSNLSALDLSALLKLKLDAIVAIGVYDGKITDYSLGMITITDDLLDYQEKLNLSLDELLIYKYFR